MVSSTGALAAMSTVLAGQPAGSPAGYECMQHIKPNAERHLADLLQRATALRVVPATDGAALEPGLVLVVPAGAHLIVKGDYRVHLLHTGGIPSPASRRLLLSTDAAYQALSRLWVTSYLRTITRQHSRLFEIPVLARAPLVTQLVHLINVT